MDKVAGESCIFLDDDDDDDDDDVIENGNKFATPAARVHRDNNSGENGHRAFEHLPIKEPTPKSSTQHPNKDLNLVEHNSTPFKLRRSYTFWNSLEIRALEKGVRKYGHGNWSAILHGKRNVLKRRTSVDLKDEWRNKHGQPC